MTKLLNKAQQRQGRLKRAGDADRDPADLGAQETASDSVSDNDIQDDSVSASQKASASAVLPDRGSASKTDSLNAVDPASENTSVSARASASESASRKTIGKASKPASKSTSGKAGRSKRQRRLGRPKGPDRVATTVRLLAGLDEVLTDACTDTGAGPQDVIDAALADWLITHGYLDKHTLPPEVAAVMARVASRLTWYAAKDVGGEKSSESPARAVRGEDCAPEVTQLVAARERHFKVSRVEVAATAAR